MGKFVKRESIAWWMIDWSMSYHHVSCVWGQLADIDFDKHYRNIWLAVLPLSDHLICDNQNHGPGKLINTWEILFQMVDEGRKQNPSLIKPSCFNCREEHWSKFKFFCKTFIRWFCWISRIEDVMKSFEGISWFMTTRLFMVFMPFSIGLALLPLYVLAQIR